MHQRRVLIYGVAPILLSSLLFAAGVFAQTPSEEINLEAQDPAAATAPEVITELPPEESGVAPSPAAGTSEPNQSPEALNESNEATPPAATDGEAVEAQTEVKAETQESQARASQGRDKIDIEIEEPSKSFAVQKDCKCTTSYLLPYRDRRESWSWTFGAGVLQFSPLNYKPDFVVNTTFDSYYGTAEAPMVSLDIGLQKNFSFGSLGLELGAGRYSNTASDSAVLTVTPIELSLKAALDTLFREPYVVPYGSAGIYTMLYDESQASKSVKGNTRVSFFYTAGALFQLDWLDKDSELVALVENGLENTFLYAEIKGYFASAKPDPDFATNPQFGAGMKLEF